MERDRGSVARERRRRGGGNLKAREIWREVWRDPRQEARSAPFFRIAAIALGSSGIAAAMLNARTWENASAKRIKIKKRTSG